MKQYLFTRSAELHYSIVVDDCDSYEDIFDKVENLPMKEWKVGAIGDVMFKMITHDDYMNTPEYQQMVCSNCKKPLWLHSNLVMTGRVRDGKFIEYGFVYKCECGHEDHTGFIAEV